MSTVIKVENLSKKYTIRHEHQGRYSTLRDTIVQKTEHMTKRILSPFTGKKEHTSAKEEIWALKGVSFEVKQGERIGIIGRNGSGKSTLLKLLSRITEPTEGRIHLKGRVASLLEVGTGFHPELTGRENIFLNGAVLGMSRVEIKRKFDQIVEFSGVEKFLDTPVKRYSSGMQVRLAFSVAAHLEPEISLVDEVLAVGDYEFQKKCLGKMDEVARGGRTVLFVSHNMGAVRQLCEKAYLLNAGILVTEGDAQKVILKYLESSPSAESPEELAALIQTLPPDPVFRLESVSMFQSDHEVMNSVYNGEPLDIEITYRVLEKTKGLRIYIDLCDTEDTLLFRSFHDEQGHKLLQLEPGTYTSKVTIPADLFSPVNYEIRIMATIFNQRSLIPYPGIVIPINVNRTGRSNRAYPMEPIRGKLAPALDWVTTSWRCCDANQEENFN